MTKIARRTARSTVGMVTCLLAGLAAAACGSDARGQIPDDVRDAPWKTPLEAGSPEASLEQYAYRIGTWTSEEWLGEGDDRHRIRAVYEWGLDGTLLEERAYRVYADGREDLYLKGTLFLNSARPDVAVTYYFFDDGLFADAVWIDEGGGVQRLDCDLHWPDGTTGKVRDVYVVQGPDRYLWRTFWVRDGEVEEEPSGGWTMVRERSST